MQTECNVDFNYLSKIGLDKPTSGVVQFDMNSFVGPGWVKEELDDLWCRNYEINKKHGIKRFDRTWDGTGKVAVLVGASPGVLKQIETLKQLDENFIIISCNTIYGELVKSGVRVDYVFAVEAHDHIKQDFAIRDAHTELIASPFICPEVLEIWNGKKSFYMLGGGQKYQAMLEADGVGDIDVGGGNTVSTSACWAYKYLNCRDFVLIGTSLSYYDKYYFDGRTTEHVGGFENERLGVKAIDMYGDIVKVTPGQLSYKVWLENFIREASDANFINSTEDGVLGVVPEIINFDGENGQYKVKFLPWLNIMPFTVAVKAYKQKLKEIG